MSHSSRVTMSEIAKTVGVSVMTVSRSLKNHPRISEATRQRVQQAAQEMGYRPDPVISRLMTQLRLSDRSEHELIAWITNFPISFDWRKEPTLASLHEGVRERASLLGYRLEEFNLGEESITPRRLNGILRARGIRGLVIAPHLNPGATLDLEWGYFAAATCGFTLASPSLHRATSCHFQAMHIAWDEVIRKGYRRVGLALSADQNQRVNEQSRGGILTKQLHYPAANRIPPLITSDFTAQNLLRWFHKHKPDVIISISAALEFLADAKIRIPDECAFALINAPQQGHAGVNHRMGKTGAALVDLVIEQLNTNHLGIPEVPKLVLTTCSWQDGPTVRARSEAEIRSTSQPHPIQPIQSQKKTRSGVAKSPDISTGSRRTTRPVPSAK